MQIVIDIPEGAYKTLTSSGVDWLGAEHILSSVANGIVLPKGHGDLVDRNTVLDMMNYGILEDNIKTIPSVIPADIGE